jgi:hypothetical protein
VHWLAGLRGWADVIFAKENRNKQVDLLRLRQRSTRYVTARIAAIGMLSLHPLGALLFIVGQRIALELRVQMALVFVKFDLFGPLAAIFAATMSNACEIRFFGGSSAVWAKAVLL